VGRGAVAVLWTSVVHLALQACTAGLELGFRVENSLGLGRVLFGSFTFTACANGCARETLQVWFLWFLDSMFTCLPALLGVALNWSIVMVWWGSAVEGLGCAEHMDDECESHGGLCMG
jgi:hypothetical protein